MKEIYLYRSHLVIQLRSHDWTHCLEGWDSSSVWDS